MNKINWLWVGISMVLLLITQVVLSFVFFLLGVMTLGVGLLLFLVIKPVSFWLTGYLSGVLSPGVTIKEPAIGAAAATILGALFESSRDSVSLFWTIVASLAAFGFALWGAQVGERHQGQIES